MKEYFLSNINNADDKYMDIKTLEENFYDNISSDDIVTIQGGDGTLHNFINSIQNDYPNIILDKKGTGNDFARMLTKEYKKASIYSVNNKKFINGFGIGFDAEVCDRVNKVNNKSQFVYLQKAIESINQMIPYELEIVVDGIEHQFSNVMLAVFQNGKYIGNGMKITPNAQIESDELEICIVHNVNKVKFITLLPLVFVGLHTKIRKNVKILKGNEITGKLNMRLKAQCEGEVFNLNSFVIKKINQINIKEYK